MKQKILLISTILIPVLACCTNSKKEEEKTYSISAKLKDSAKSKLYFGNTNNDLLLKSDFEVIETCSDGTVTTLSETNFTVSNSSSLPISFPYIFSYDPYNYDNTQQFIITSTHSATNKISLTLEKKYHFTNEYIGFEFMFGTSTSSSNFTNTIKDPGSINVIYSIDSTPAGASIDSSAGKVTLLKDDFTKCTVNAYACQMLESGDIIYGVIDSYIIKKIATIDGLTVDENGICATDDSIAPEKKWLHLPEIYDGNLITKIKMRDENLGGFQNCTNFTDVNIPDTLIEIGKNAFKDATQLESVFISENVSYIDENAFYITPETANDQSEGITEASFENEEGWQKYNSTKNEWEDIDVSNSEVNATLLKTGVKLRRNEYDPSN